MCGGSLIAPDVILSAAHCAQSFDRVLIGFHDLASADTKQSFYAREIIQHPLYSSETLQYDVMLILLDQPVNGVKPIPINDDSGWLQADEVLDVVGWGATYENETTVLYPNKMQATDLHYVPNTACQQIRDEDGFALGASLLDDMMCATGFQKDACYGDSGSPLLKLRSDSAGGDMQVGVVSWGVSCGGAIPGVYHRLSESYEWIRESVCSIALVAPSHFDCVLAPSPSPIRVASQPPVDNPSTFWSSTFAPSQLFNISSETENIHEKTISTETMSTSSNSPSPPNKPTLRFGSALILVFYLTACWL